MRGEFFFPRAIVLCAQECSGRVRVIRVYARLFGELFCQIAARLGLLPVNVSLVVLQGAISGARLPNIQPGGFVDEVQSCDA